MDPIKEIAAKHNLIVVEDCAQSHLAEYKHKKTGGLASAASFSFYPGKNLGAYGEGGAVTTNDEALGKKFKMMREHGSSQKYHHEMYGHNYRMEGIQGAVLGVKLKYLNGWTNERRRAAHKYKECLKGVDQITLPFEMEYAKHVFHLFVIQVKSKDKTNTSATRDALAKFLEDNGVSTGLHYPIPLHVQPCFKSLGYKKGDFPVAEQLAETCLSLPIFPELSDTQIEFVSEKVKEFFK
jgi:dTDP-4-amino-4,6-dideoxygalactose transaminase